MIKYEPGKLVLEGRNIYIYIQERERENLRVEYKVLYIEWFTFSWPWPYHINIHLTLPRPLPLLSFPSTLPPASSSLPSPPPSTRLPPPHHKFPYPTFLPPHFFLARYNRFHSKLAQFFIPLSLHRPIKEMLHYKNKERLVNIILRRFFFLLQYV